MNPDWIAAAACAINHTMLDLSVRQACELATAALAAVIPLIQAEEREACSELAENAYHTAKDRFSLPGRGPIFYAANQDLKWSEAFSPDEIAAAILARGEP